MFHHQQPLCGPSLCYNNNNNNNNLCHPQDHLFSATDSSAQELLAHFSSLDPSVLLLDNYLHNRDGSNSPIWQDDNEDMLHLLNTDNTNNNNNNGDFSSVPPTPTMCRSPVESRPHPHPAQQQQQQDALLSALTGAVPVVVQQQVHQHEHQEQQLFHLLLQQQQHQQQQAPLSLPTTTTEDWLAHPRMFSALAEMARHNGPNSPLAPLLQYTAENPFVTLTAQQRNALCEPYSVNSIGYSCFLAPTSTNPQQDQQQQQQVLNLNELARAFRVGASLVAVGGGGSGEGQGDGGILCVEEVTPVSANNFVIIKAGLLGSAVSIKVYAHAYIQIFGLKDTPEATAARLADGVCSFALRTINGNTNTWRIDRVVPLSLSAKHTGVSTFQMGFNAEVLRGIYQCAALQFGSECVVPATHGRNGAVVVNFSSSATSNNRRSKLGSIMYHPGTGTTQLMGVNGCPAIAAQQLQDLCLAFPLVLKKQDRPRRIRSQPSAARVRRERAKSGTTKTTTSTKKQQNKRKSKKTSRCNDYDDDDSEDEEEDDEDDDGRHDVRRRRTGPIRRRNSTSKRTSTTTTNTASASAAAGGNYSRFSPAAMMTVAEEGALRDVIFARVQANDMDDLINQLAATHSHHTFPTTTTFT